MKRFLLLGAASVLAGTTHAQMNLKNLPTHATEGTQGRIPHRAWNVEPSTSGTAQKTTATTSRWYSHPQALAAYNNVTNIFDSRHMDTYLLWQDSSVRYQDENGGISDFGARDLSIGQVFHPQASTYTDRAIASNRGLQAITSGDAYTIDSVRVLGRYERRYNTAPDTLIFTFVSETQARKFAYLTFTGNTGVNHNIDSAAAQLWSGADYLVRPVNQISYSIGGAALSPSVQVKVPLTAATFADSMSSGLQYIKCAPNLQIPAGCKTSVSVTFKAGSAYTPGTLFTNYNYFAYASCEVDSGGYVAYPANDNNMSSILTKDSNMVTADLGYYVPTIAFSSGAFGAEVHVIEFKATCQTCNRVGIENAQAAITSVKAFPSPANNGLTIALTLKEAGVATVALSDASGKVVRNASFGKVAAGQQANLFVNTADLPSGVYFYTVEAAGQRTTDRVVVAH